MRKFLSALLLCCAITMASGQAFAAWPATPTAPSATAGQTSITVVWTPPTLQPISVDVYRSTKSTSGFVKLNTDPVTSSSYVDTTAIAGTTYYYKVQSAGSLTGVSGFTTVVNAKVPSAPISVSVAPTSATVPANGSQAFIATVTNTTNTKVNWTVVEPSCGSVDVTGLYTAPNSGALCTVVATSQADTTKSASAGVVVTAPPPPPPISVAVSPTTATVPASGSQQFSATVTNALTDLSVSWLATCGTITATGLYVAPPGAAVCSVSATSNEDLSKSASALVTVLAAPPPLVAISVAPASASIAANSTQQFTATVTNTTNTAVTWVASCGSVDAGGSYTAPGVAATCLVTATSLADSSKAATATVTVTVVTPPPPGDPTVGLLSADRSTTWNPGLNAVGGILTRTTVCKTVPPSASAVPAIQAAIDACPAGQVVQLQVGTYGIGGGDIIFLNKGVTLRGYGSATLLQVTAGAKVNSYIPGSHNGPIIIVGPQRYGNNFHGVAGSSNLTADGAKGVTSITVAAGSNFHVGQYVLLDEKSGASWQTDPGGRGKVLAAPDWRVTWQLHSPGQDTDDPIAYNASTGAIGNCSCNDADAAAWFSRQDRPTAEIKHISTVVGNVVTFDSPLHISYRVGHVAQLSWYEFPFVEHAGVENLKLFGGDDGNIRFQWAGASWAKGIEDQQWLNEGVAMDNTMRIELRDSYIHDAAWASPGGGGYAISLSDGSAEELIENNIVVRANKVIVSRSSGAGSVAGYNYMDEGYINGNGAWIEIGLNASHMVGPHHVLFEGNYSFNADSDKTHGSSTYNTYYRNQLRGIRAKFTNQAGGTIDDANQPGNGPQRCMGAGFYSYWMSYVGNVCGAAGKMAGWAQDGDFVSGQPGIWFLGWDDWNPYPVDAKVKATATRHGNFDYLTNSVVWDPSNSDHTLPPSFYLKAKPAFFGSLTWPWVDPTSATPVLTLPAKARYDAGTPFTAVP